MSDLIEAHVAYLRAAGRAERTLIDRGEALGRFARTLPGTLVEATTDDLVAFLAAAEWAAWTRRTNYNHLHGFYRWAAKFGHVERDPSADLTAPRKPADAPHPATEEQLRIALERSNDWWQRPVILAAFAGLRTNESANLLREDVTAERIRIRNGKGGKSVTLPCHPEIWKRLGPLPAGPVLPRQRDGEPVRQLQTLARHHFDAIGLPDVRLHMFRHRFACVLLEHGADIRTVQSLMRHSSLATTAAYLDIVDARRVSAIAALPTIG